MRCGCARIPTRHGGHNHYYYCPYRDPLKAGGPEKRCHERQVRADELDAFVFDQVHAALLKPELLTAGETAVVSRQPLPDDELLAAQFERLERQVANTEAERRRLVDCYQAGLIELRELTRRADDVRARSAHLVAQREQLVAAPRRARHREPPALPSSGLRFYALPPASTASTSPAASASCVLSLSKYVSLAGASNPPGIPLDQPPEPPKPASPRPHARRSRRRHLLGEPAEEL